MHLLAADLQDSRLQCVRTHTNERRKDALLLPHELLYVMDLTYNFACCFVWVWSLVADIAGGKEAEGVWEHGVE